MKPDELKAIEEEIAALGRRSDELAARVTELREQAESPEATPTETRGEPNSPNEDAIEPA
jgi:hypothetical protein